MFEIKLTVNKGYGVFAIHAIAANTNVVQEAPILTAPRYPRDPKAEDEAIEAAFKKLSVRDQEAVLKLHEGSHPQAKTKVTRIFHANVFGTGDLQRLYLTASKINYSCVPNAIQHDSGIVVSDRDIAPGEEVTISYLPPCSEAMTADQRAIVFRLHYKFQCRCSACWPRPQSWTNDARRQLIGHLSYALQDQSAPNFSLDNQLKLMVSGAWPPEPTSSMVRLTPTRKIEFNFLLARLREAEGLKHSTIVDCYMEAGRLLALEQQRYGEHDRTKDILFLETGRCLEAWFKKAIELDQNHYDVGHSKVKDGRAFLKRLVEGLPCLQVMAALPDSGSRRKPNRDNEFALRMIEEDPMMETLDRDACETLIRGRVCNRWSRRMNDTEHGSKPRTH